MLLLQKICIWKEFLSRYILDGLIFPLLCISYNHGLLYTNIGYQHVIFGMFYKQKRSLFSKERNFKKCIKLHPGILYEKEILDKWEWRQYSVQINFQLLMYLLSKIIYITSKATNTKTCMPFIDTRSDMPCVSKSLNEA